MNVMKIVMALTLALSLTACAGQRGTIGDQKVCTNEYLLGVISITELFSPCGK